MVAWVALATLVLVLGLAAFIAGRISAGDVHILGNRQISELSTQISQLKSDNARLTDAYNSAATQLEIARGARKTLEAQVGRLEDERDRLNRDLALFDNLFPTNGQSSLPTIRSFRIEPVMSSGTPSTWRYRALVMRGGKSTDSFKGQFRLQVRYRLDGRDIQAASEENGRSSQPIELQRYRRIEGHFQSPPGATLLGATAQVMQNGKPVAESRFKP
jgi:outer membrane murein-binding lipoprotein Lpp